MPKIEARNISQITGVETQNIVPPGKQISTEKAGDSFDTKITTNNQLYPWEVIKGNALLKAPNIDDCSALNNLSNEALIARLSSIELTLSKAKKLDFSKQEIAEIELGHIMIKEQIRRCLMVLEGKNNLNSTGSSLQNNGG